MASIKPRSTESGRRYDVRWWAEGAQRRKSFQRRADAEEFRRRVEAAELAGLLTDLHGGSQQLEPYAERWLSTRIVNGRPLAPMTKAGYQALLRRNVYPTYFREDENGQQSAVMALGRTQLRRITTEVVRE